MLRSKHLETLAREIENLSPADQLRLAAGMLENRMPGLAHSIVARMEKELGAALMLRDAPRKAGLT